MYIEDITRWRTEKMVGRHTGSGFGELGHTAPKRISRGTPAPSPSGNQNASRMVIIDLEGYAASFKST